MHTDTVTHSPPHSVTHPRIVSHTRLHTRTHSLTRSPTDSRTYSPVYLVSHPAIHSSSHPVTHSLTHSLTHSPALHMFNPLLRFRERCLHTHTHTHIHIYIHTCTHTHTFYTQCMCSHLYIYPIQWLKENSRSIFTQRNFSHAITDRVGNIVRHHDSFDAFENFRVWAMKIIILFKIPKFKLCALNFLQGAVVERARPQLVPCVAIHERWFAWVPGTHYHNSDNDTILGEMRWRWEWVGHTVVSLVLWNISGVIVYFVDVSCRRSSIYIFFLNKARNILKQIKILWHIFRLPLVLRVTRALCCVCTCDRPLFGEFGAFIKGIRRTDNLRIVKRKSKLGLSPNQIFVLPIFPDRANLDHSIAINQTQTVVSTKCTLFLSLRHKVARII